MATTTFKAGIISICDYGPHDPGESIVGYSEVMVDYPVIEGPDMVFDQVDILMKPWGRDPADGQVVFVNETAVDRWKGQILQNGVNALSDRITPPLDNPIDASIVEAGLTTAGIVQMIDPDAKYVVWGMWARGNVAEQEALPPALRIWWVDAPVDPERQSTFDVFMTARGTDPTLLANYWLAHPDATYRTVGKDFEIFL